MIDHTDTLSRRDHGWDAGSISSGSRQTRSILLSEPSAHIAS